MKILGTVLIVAILWLSHRGHATEPAPVGACMGNDHPSSKCKTCETCFYCGKKGRWGARPENSGTCSVCQAKRESEKQSKGTTHP